MKLNAVYDTDTKLVSLPIEQFEMLVANQNKKEVETAKNTVSVSDINGAILDTLSLIDMPKHIKGYKYIKHALLIIHTEPRTLEVITKELYPAVAQAYQTTASRVERAIRHAIESTFSVADSAKTFSKIFKAPLFKTKPTNSQFLAILNEFITRQFEEKISHAV